MSNTIYLHKCFIQCSDDDDEEYHTASPAIMCLKVGDSNPVEAYLNSGVDPTWKLSHPEASYWRGQGQGCMTRTTIYVASELAVSI